MVRVFPSHLQCQTSFLVIHPKEPHMERGRNHIISNSVYGASCAFKKAHPFGYEYVCMCVSSRMCTCMCVYVYAPQQAESSGFLVLCRGILKCFFPSLPLLISSSCSSRTFQHLLSMLSAGECNEGSPVHRKSGWSQAERGLDLTGARQW